MTSGDPADPAHAAVRWCEVSDRPLSVERHRTAVADTASGAEVVFAGVVRDHDDGRPVVRLEYEAHPGALEVLRGLAASFAARDGVHGVAVSHRVGALDVGDVAFVTAVSSAHRDLAFAVCAELVDEVKRQLPVWKHQVFADGTDEWVNSP